jgi:ankyrin repeat protein
MRRLLHLKQASDEAVRFVTENACMDGNAEVLGFVLQEIKPRISIELFRLASVSSKGPALLKMLVDHGGDLNARHDTNDAKRMTPLHDLVGSGKLGAIRTLVDCGADVNARDGLGRTPLMVLASSLEGIEVGNDHAVFTRQALESGDATLLSGEAPSTVSCFEAVQALLALGADAKPLDFSGNDAIDHYTFEYFRCDKEPAAEIIALLREAGAKGSAVTLELFRALKQKSLEAFRAAIRSGADVNRLTPPPVPFTPLTWAATGGATDELEFVRALLKAGADPNKMDRSATPLIRAARSGNLAMVRELLGAGADLHTVCEQGDYIENAYSAAEGNDEVRDYLKSRGARNPIRETPESLTPGVKSWNDFSEVLVRGTVDMVAAGTAKMIKGGAQSNVYGLSVSPGKQAYVVVRPKGMDWCNVFRVAPPPLRFEDAKRTETAASALAKACCASVLVIEYSGTADAASIVRIEPTGKTTKDQGWDRESLQEMVEAMGDDAPEWAKKQLAKTSDDEPRSTERLVMLAEQEKFVVAAFGLNVEVGRKVDVEFTGFGEDAFDGVTFVTN